jgi:hypothetical protein
MMMKNPLLCMTAAVSLVALPSVAHASSAYDGSWDLLFVTQRGACDPTYDFSVNITDVVTHPNLVRFRGYVARSGAVRASVTDHDKYAVGSGRLSSNSGEGGWNGNSGTARCSGYCFLTGSYITSLDMAGASVTVSVLDGHGKEL